jgi:hypothetical protein
MRGNAAYRSADTLHREHGASCSAFDPDQYAEWLEQALA